MHSPLISIITATYNASHTIEELISSIIPQKNNKIEFIIVDGASTDNTISIIKKYEKNIDHLISEPDNGIYDAWNKGIKNANGVWIMFLGADDILMPNALSEYLNLINSKQLSTYDYISANNEYIDNSGKLLKILGKSANWSNMRKTMSAAHVGSLHNKTNLFNQVGFYNLSYKICADYELLLRKKDTFQCYFLNKRIAQMKVGGVSFTLKAIYETFKIRREHKTIPILYNYFLLIRDIIAFELFKFRKSLCADI
jgi:glycosyltransferase involved in cell wall biosynthesis